MGRYGEKNDSVVRGVNGGMMMNEPETDDYYNRLYKPIEGYNDNILEIGCGYGHFSNFIWNKRRFIVSLDINKSNIVNARQLYPHLNFCQGDAQKLPFADKSFDIVVSIETFEHLPDIKSHLSEVCRILNDEGIYLLKTPNVLWDTPYWIIFRKWSYKQLKKPGNHISTQTYFGLKRILTQHGFKVTFVSFNQICKIRKKKLVSRFFFVAFEKSYGYLPFFLQPPLFCMAKKTTK